MKHLLKTIALSLALCCLAAPSLADMKVVINPKNTAATNGAVFEGWGTSLCWWANRLGYSDSLAQQSADLFFSMDGLGFNIMRYNIGGGDDPAHTHITRTDSILPPASAAGGILDISSHRSNSLAARAGPSPMPSVRSRM